MLHNTIMRNKWANELEELKKENERLHHELEIAKLKKENRDLRERIRDLDDEPSTITYTPSPDVFKRWYTWSYSPDEHTDIVLCASDKWLLEDFKDMLLKD